MKFYIKKCKNLNYKIINTLFVIYINNSLVYCNVLPSFLSRRPTQLYNTNSRLQSSNSNSNTSELLLVNSISNNTVIGNETISSTVESTEAVTTQSTTSSKGVWCYCNYPECVRSGYMCHSSEADRGGCFSKTVANANGNKGEQVHLYRQWSVESLARGCIELLPSTERESCLGKMKSLEESLASNNDKGQPYDYNGFLPDDSDGLRCCRQNMCNYEIPKPIIIREIEESEVTLSPEKSWLQGLTIGVSVLGVIVLIFLIVFAGRILTASEEKNRSSELLNELSSRDFYIKVPYFIERTPSSDLRESGGRTEGCSILCVKSLQKNIQRRHVDDVADYCRFHPLSLSSSNRHSFSCPSSLAILPPTPSPSGELEEGREELQPLRGRDSEDGAEASLQES